MTNKLRIYTSPSAFPNPQRLRLFLHEKGIAEQFEEVIYDMAPGGDQRKWPHLKMNPWGETPTLELADGGYLSESVAVARYLDLSMPGRKVMGETALEQAQDTMWNDRIWVQVLYRITTAPSRRSVPSSGPSTTSSVRNSPRSSWEGHQLVDVMDLTRRPRRVSGGV